MIGRHRFAAILIAGLVAGVSVACGGGTAPTGQAGAQARRAAAPVGITTVSRGPIASTFAYSGNIQATAEVSVLPKATGRIVALHVDVGDAIEAGQRIA